MSRPRAIRGTRSWRLCLHLKYSILAIGKQKRVKDRLREAALQGLPDAVRMFKGEKWRKHKFSTFVTWFMKESVEKEIGFNDKKADA